MCIGQNALVVNANHWWTRKAWILMVYCGCGERSQILLRKCDITSGDGRKFFLFILMDCSVGVKIILFKVEIYYPTATDGRNHLLSIYPSIYLSIYPSVYSGSSSARPHTFKPNWYITHYQYSFVDKQILMLFCVDCSLFECVLQA